MEAPSPRWMLGSETATPPIGMYDAKTPRQASATVMAGRAAAGGVGGVAGGAGVADTGVPSFSFAVLRHYQDY
ncbi:hypothetical protein GCM10010329_32970 [Streptomyces spiroverticillatus]|uniref:Uncharacterized protein n=1 Tax=Streptomyces finlayi TaxID=67296 RepID=A0A919C9I6_9ACTN|nr:hypothetical protein GCM10010329_32970 [Streptomyces spiroverticillatus]GHC90933.1 hypothetical protein GCM10010334_25380 [Streptomyces finlayi]